MTGTVAFDERVAQSIRVIQCSWTSTAGGAAADTTTNTYDGKVLWVVTNPDGTAVPSDNYSLTVLDADGVDVLAGACLVNRDTANTEYVAEASLGCVGNSKLTFTIAAAGAATKGVVYVYIR